MVKKYILYASLIAVVILVGLFYTYNFIDIDPESKLGCRAPSDDACQECKLKTESSCEVYHAVADAKWYNGKKQECPDSMIACASCTVREEAELKEIMFLNKFRRCGCDAIGIGIDPCNNPNSCQCICSRYRKAIESCPLI